MAFSVKKKLNGNLLLYINVLLLFFVVFGSYFRFAVIHDYLVAYEGDCDPAEESCYADCEDDECTELYYYSVIERHAAEVKDLCGDDVTECDDAYECQPDVNYCEIYFCDPEEEEETTCVGNIDSL